MMSEVADYFQYTDYSKSSPLTEQPPTPENIMELGMIESNAEPATPFTWHVKNEEIAHNHNMNNMSNPNHLNSNNNMSIMEAPVTSFSEIMEMPQHANHFANFQSTQLQLPSMHQQLPQTTAMANLSNFSSYFTSDELSTNNWLQGLETSDLGPLESEWSILLGQQQDSSNGQGNHFMSHGQPFGGSRKNSLIIKSALMGENNFMSRANQLPTTPANSAVRTAATCPTTDVTDNKKLKRISKASRRGAPSRALAPSPGSKPVVKKTTQRSREQSSKYRGVSRCSKDGRFQSRIRVGAKVIYLGRFKNEVQAARAYDVAAIQYHEKRACLNFPDQIEKPAV